MKFKIGDSVIVKDFPTYKGIVTKTAIFPNIGNCYDILFEGENSTRAYTEVCLEFADSTLRQEENLNETLDSIIRKILEITEFVNVQFFPTYIEFEILENPIIICYDNKHNSVYVDLEFIEAKEIYLSDINKIAKVLEILEKNWDILKSFCKS